MTTEMATLLASINEVQVLCGYIAKRRVPKGTPRNELQEWEADLTRAADALRILKVRLDLAIRKYPATR